MSLNSKVSGREVRRQFAAQNQFVAHDLTPVVEALVTDALKAQVKIDQLQRDVAELKALPAKRWDAFMTMLTGV